MDLKLRKTVLLMLSSTHSGEVMAARDAMLRIAHLDIHRLATTFTGALASRSDSEELTHQDMAQELQDWDETSRKLSEKERTFVDDMVGWRRPSEKQLDWLRKIYGRMRQWGMR